MHKKFHHKNNLIILSLVTCLCLTGCGTTDSRTSVDSAEDNPIVSTAESVVTENNTVTATDEFSALESSFATTETTTIEANGDETSIAASDIPTPATLIAYAKDLEEAAWHEGDLDIRFPEDSATDMNWNQMLPVTLFGEVDIIASIQAPLTLENIQAAGCQLITEDGSNAVFLTDGSAQSYIVGYLNKTNAQPEYIVADLDIATLLGSDAPTLQHVLTTLGTPDFGFAYEALEARYYYLFDSYYLEVSMNKADTAQETWNVAEVLYFDATAFLNFDFEQELGSIKESGLNGFTSDYLAPEGF
ncbi:MAG: hypothetical protein E7290_10935 [Lachnospiraceae bacterium]|nr:hypothetical protein [Lachnospiraceae bacterium]